MRRITGTITRAIDVRPREIRALAWAWLYIVALMASYSILRPIRDEMGVAGGTENLPWLFTATLAGMIVVNPVFAALVARLPRATFIAVAYRFFALNLIAFAVLLRFASDAQNIWIGRIFFVWASIFNLFVVSVFWGLMADVFDERQGKRLFGFIAAGMSLGGIAGAAVTAALAPRVQHLYLLLGSAVLLEVAVFGARRLSRETLALTRLPAGRGPIGGSVFAGIRKALASPYLLNVSLYILLYTITSTLLYFQQAEIARAAFSDRGARTAFFARIDLLVNVLTLFGQLFLAAHVLRRLGVGLTLTILPVLTMLGFAALSVWQTVAVIVSFQVLRRAGNFALTRPAREVLFTVVAPEDKYKAKSFIDTVVYRTGDQLGAWSTALLRSLGIGMAGMALVALPLALVWLINGLWLGRRQERLARESGTGAIPVRAAEAPHQCAAP